MKIEDEILAAKDKFSFKLGSSCINKNSNDIFFLGKLPEKKSKDEIVCDV